MSEATIGEKGLSTYQLKVIAIVAMLIDHIGWGFFSTATLTGQLIHIVGRLTAPIMCFFIAEGYHYTHDLKRYLERMAVFAAISAVAYSYFESGGRFGFAGLGMIFTLFIALAAVAVWDKTKFPRPVKVLILIGFCVISMMGDWPIFAVLWVFYFYLYREDKKKKLIAFTIIALTESTLATVMMIVRNPDYWWNMLFQYGALLALPLLMQYSGRRGRKTKASKWFFYAFYPAHLFVLGFLRFYFFG